MILFVCSQGKLRSRTAELLCLFGGVHARSAGSDQDAEVPLSDVLIRKASTIICMEAEHYDALRAFPSFANRVGPAPVVLHVPDRFDRLEPALVEKLISNVRLGVPLGAELADAMQRGATLLAGQPGYRDALGTRTPRVFGSSSNPAFDVFPQ
ncbi:hypothetical protein [Paraburkholderia sp. A3RO-2L]|jgi:predicted protein tyrosine phosphatase|uniref:hypothetical protein n=1 Tax=unclassified Paraburkholderia TaxID=2615204 RepID=UPI003DA9E66D